MAYTKQTWACGDEITAEKLNHMEDGIAEGGAGQMNSCFFVRVVFQDSNFVSMDKTFNEIADAFESKIPCFVVLEEKASMSSPQQKTLQMDGDRYSSFYGTSTFVTYDNELRSTRIIINNDGTVTKVESNITLNT